MMRGHPRSEATAAIAAMLSDEAMSASEIANALGVKLTVAQQSISTLLKNGEAREVSIMRRRRQVRGFCSPKPKEKPTWERGHYTGPSFLPIRYQPRESPYISLGLDGPTCVTEAVAASLRLPAREATAGPRREWGDYSAKEAT